MQPIIDLLNGDGATLQFIAEKLGKRKPETAKMLRGMGAFYCNRARAWKLPNRERLKKCNNTYLFGRRCDK